MAEVLLTQETLRLIAAFERLTRVPVKDCVEGDSKIIFLVNADEVRKAVGKGREKIHKLRNVLKKDVDVVGYSPDTEQFVRSLFFRYGVKSVSLDTLPDGLLATVTVDAKDRGRAIGKGRRNLNLAKEMAARHSDVRDIRVR